jgi:hypothetical protein
VNTHKVIRVYIYQRCECISVVEIVLYIVVRGEGGGRWRMWRRWMGKGGVEGRGVECE